ncbi:MAG: PKD domain-containing protein [Candidatus Promineifilaceae bacterium]|nr:PKD domain-containing protein [Candidatus Promineifilaceae bacterium]
MRWSSKTVPIFISLSILILFLGAVSRASADEHQSTDLTQNPTATPAPTSTPTDQSPEISSFSIQQAAPTDRGVDPATLVVNLFDAADHIDPVRTIHWDEPLSFRFDCFGESFPFEGCKLVDDLTDGANWSLKWEGTLLVPADGHYTFSLPGHDDGVRFLIDGSEIVDSGWRYPDPDEKPSPQTVVLTAGEHDFAIDYEQRVPFIAEMELRWDGPGFAEEVVPLAADRRARIEAIELTQSIQELQSLDAFIADLSDDGQPPVSILALKPAVARIYFGELDVAAVGRVRFRVPGVVSETAVRGILPGCSVGDQRLRRDGCSSADIYFGPPEGDWVGTVEVLDTEGDVIQSYDLAVSSVTSESIRQVPVTVCRLPFPSDPQICQDGSSLDRHLHLLRSSAPSHRVHTVGPIRNITISDQEFIDKPEKEPEDWWSEVMTRLVRLWEEDGEPSGVFYHGMVDEDALAPNIGGISRTHPTMVTAATRVRPDNFQGTLATVAHETGHLLGRHHPETFVPKNSCLEQREPYDDDWPYDDVRIQEVGFDVQGLVPAASRIKHPQRTFDWLSACRGDRWVSPHTYRGVLQHLISPEFGESAIQEEGQFWELSGFISEGELSLNPLFTLETRGPTDPGVGDHRIEVLNPSGGVLFNRHFDPSQQIHQNAQETPSEVLLELVPVFEDASEIQIVAPDGTILEKVELEGAEPSVAITAPNDWETREEQRVISWSGSDPDSDSLAYRVEFSHDGGATTSLLTGILRQEELTVDFGNLPGCADTCVLIVRVSDGVNSSSEVIRDFSVTKKSPEVEILSPQDGVVLNAGEPVHLQALTLDRDEGYLDGDSVSWVSNRDGNLGQGRELPLTFLSEGAHHITVTAIDGDGNESTDSISLLVDATEPELDLFVVRDQIPSSCVDVTISASDESRGSGLRAVEYSLDGGDSWNSIPVNNLPFNFLVPGSGRIELVAHAMDEAGNLSIEYIPFSIATPCPGANRPPTADAGGPYDAAEGQTISLDASGSTDPDDNLASFAWDLDNDGQFDDATGLTTEVTFGDNGVHQVGLRVTDAFGQTDTDSAEVVVGNLPPQVELDVSPAISTAGGEAFLGRTGISQHHAASAIDPGSDDLTFEWSFGSTSTYFNDGVGPDPFPSPDGVFPFTAEDTAEALFEKAGLEEVLVEVSDDDGATVSSELPKIVTGNAVCARSQGFWMHQFRSVGRQHVEESTLLAYIDIVNFVSDYFSEVVPLMEFEDAQEVFDVSGPGLRSKVEAQVAAAWFNFSHGAVAWDEPIETDDDELELAPFNAVIAEAEAIILDSNATNDELERAKDLAEAINELDHEGDECEDEFDDNEGQEDEETEDEEEEEDEGEREDD